MCGSLSPCDYLTACPLSTWAPPPFPVMKTLVQSSMREGKLLGLACCLSYNKPQSSAFNHVWWLLIKYTMHWKCHNTGLLSAVGKGTNIHKKNQNWLHHFEQKDLVFWVCRHSWCLQYFWDEWATFEWGDFWAQNSRSCAKQKNLCDKWQGSMLFGAYCLLKTQGYQKAF